jgi:hypothetical protein
MADTVEVNFVLNVTEAGLGGPFPIYSGAGTASVSYGNASFPQISVLVTGITRNGKQQSVTPDIFCVGISAMYMENTEFGVIHTSNYPQWSFDGTLIPTMPYSNSMGICAINIITSGRDKDLYSVSYSGTCRRYDVLQGSNNDAGAYGPASNGEWMGQTVYPNNIDTSWFWFNSLSITITAKAKRKTITAKAKRKLKS